MLKPTHITPNFAVAGPFAAGDAVEATRLGFRSIVNFRPDGEAPDQIPSATLAVHADHAGLAYAQIPARKFEVLSDAVVSAACTAFAELPGPILALCASGQRAAIVWGAATARTASATEVLAMLERAGFNLGFLKDDLDAQADRKRWQSDATLTLAPA